MYTTSSMRKAFSMITAIFVIVIMATVGALVMSTSGKIVKNTTAQYQHEQALLYTKSYTEYTIMAVTGNDRSATCLQTITGTIGDDPNSGNGYRVRTHIAYIADGNSTGRSDVSKCDGVRILSNSVSTTSTPLTIIIDAYVDYRDPDNTAQWRTVHRRTVQKI